MTGNALVDAIEQRTRELCARVAAGGDAPPGPLLRLEGLREAALLSGAATEAALQSMLEAAHEEACGEALAQRCGERWQEDFPFPAVPLFMRRAPVSTGKGD